MAVFSISLELLLKLYALVVRFKSLTDDSRDRLRKTSYNLKTRPIENKIEVMRMTCNLDVNLDLTNFFFKILRMWNYGKKKVNQNEREWGNCLKEMSLFTIREIEKHIIKNGKSSSTIMKTTDRGKRFKVLYYLQSEKIWFVVLQN